MHANLEDLGQLLVVLNNNDISLRVLAHIQTSLCGEMMSNIIQMQPLFENTSRHNKQAIHEPNQLRSSCLHERKHRVNRMG